MKIGFMVKRNNEGPEDTSINRNGSYVNSGSSRKTLRRVSIVQMLFTLSGNVNRYVAFRLHLTNDSFFQRRCKNVFP
jgi:membrane-bound acyltransferase YfiQ involved in biofilm formation